MMSHKTDPPVVLPGVVHRERLFNLLDRRAGKPLYWVSGPGGSGKTTLVSSYLESRGIPALWYQVDASDADPASFFYHLGEAFRKTVPDSAVTLPLLTPEFLPGLATFTRHYFQDLFSSLPTPSVIVLDNYQEVTTGSLFHVLLLEGLSQIPDGIAVMALSRNEPPPVLTAPNLALRTAHLGWNDLRFSYDEAGEFAGRQHIPPLPPEALACLYSKTDGWIAGLLLVLESLKGSDLDYQALEKLPLESVFSFFANRIFDAGDPELQTLLLKTAFAPGVTAQMAERLSGLASAEPTLARLCRNSFFTGKHSPVDPTYEYHPLFREFLLERARQTYSAEEVRQLRCQTAALLEEAGRIEEAATLLIEAADWEGVTGLIMKSAPLFASEGRLETVHGWLERIPPEIRDAVPGLLYWKGVCLLLHPPIRSREYYRKAFDLYSRANDGVGIFLSWSSGAEASLYDGDFTHLDEWLALLERMRIDDVTFPSRQLKDQISMSIYNALAFRQPDHPEISRWRELGAPVVNGDADLNFRLTSAVQLFVHDLWNGNFVRATFMLEQVQRMARSGKLSPMTDITIRNGLALHAFFTGDWASGVQVAIEAIKLADEIGLHVLDCQLLGNGASCALSMGDLSTAEQLIGMLERRLGGGWTAFDKAYFHLLRGWQKTWRKEHAAASQHLEQSLQEFRASGFRPVDAVALNFMAENMRITGEPDRAREYISQGIEMARAFQNSLLEFFCLLTAVHLELDAGREEEAVELLARTMAIGRAGGYVGSWLTCPSPLLRLCVKALENGIETEYVRGLILKWGLVPESPPLHLDAWPWPLKVRTLGGFELLAEGAPIAIAGKVKKPLELMKALISLGGKGVPVETLCDALWPDADGDLAQRSFDTTLHRLRKQLGCEKALQLQAGRLSLDPRFCWVDTWAFDRIRGEADEALKEGDRLDNMAQIESLVEKCATLYQGRFLPGDGEEPWTFPMRDRLAGDFLELLTRAGDHFASRGEWERAAVWYRRGLKEETPAEELRQRLANCLQEGNAKLGSC
ncbi:hypothetical protein GMSM_01870 [Geomonas sp. Red276]